MQCFVSYHKIWPKGRRKVIHGLLDTIGITKRSKLLFIVMKNKSPAFYPYSAS